MSLNAVTNNVPDSEPVIQKPAHEWNTGDVEFMPDSSAAHFERAPKTGRIILWFTFSFLFLAIIWSSLATINEVTRGDGKVIPSRQIQIIQNLEGGILSEILVKEGQVVEKNQVLLRISDTRFSSSLRESRLQSGALLAKASRLKAEANNEDFIPPTGLGAEGLKLVTQEQILFESRKKELENNLGTLEQQVVQRQEEVSELKGKKQQLRRSYKLLLRELNLTKPLVADGAISEVEVLRLERQVNELQGEIDSTENAISRAVSKLSEANNKLNEEKLKFKNTARVELNEVSAELSQLSESSLSLEDRVDRTQVRSPVRGTVKQFLINTVGGVIKPGENLVEIVPLEDELIVEARIRPSDIGFLHPDQEATVKFSAYDFAIYGGLEAVVEHISADTILDEEGNSYYLVRLRTERNYIGEEKDPLPIIPGMQGTVDILTGKKTVLAYLLKPVLRAKERAFTER